MYYYKTPRLLKLNIETESACNTGVYDKSAICEMGISRKTYC